jgi:dihydrofolate reductase
MIVSLIVAVSENGVIGRDGDMPWRLSADLRRFKQLTMGHHIVMGRRTYESIGRLLPGRTTIIISRQPAYRVEGAIVVSSIDEALRAAAGDDEVFVVGGGEIYRQTLGIAGRIYRTLVHARLDGDTRFPSLAAEEWCCTSHQRYPADARNQYDYTFEVFERTGAL